MAITYRTNWMGPIAVSWYRKRGLVQWVSKKVDAELAAQVCDLKEGDSYQVEEYTERYCGGRIDIYGLPEEEFYNGQGEYSVQPMHHKDWEALGDLLYTFQTKKLWSYEKLIDRFEDWYDKKIRWASDQWVECSFEYLFDGKIIKLHKDKAAQFVAKMREMHEYAVKRAKELGLE